MDLHLFFMAEVGALRGILVRLLLCVLVVVLSGCATVIRPMSPATVESIPVVEPAESQILVPVTIRREVLAAMANQSIPPRMNGSGSGVVKTVVGNWDYTYDYQVSRSSLSVRVVGTTLLVGTSLTGTVTARSHGISTTVNTTMAVNISGNVSMKPDWKLDPELWGRLVVDSADIPFAFTVLGVKVGFTISVKDDMERAMQEPFADLLKSVRATVAAFDLKPQVTPLWNSLRAPLSLSSSPPTWLTLIPNGVFFSTRDSSDGDLHVMVGLQAKTGVVFGYRPEDVEIGDLPPVALPPGPSGFKLRLPVRVPFEELSKLAADEVLGKTFEVEGGKVTLHSLTVFGSGKRIAVRVDFQAKHPFLGDSRGTMYFVGRPRFDEAAQRLSVVDFDFDAQTSHALLASAEWILHSSLVKQGALAINHAFEEMGDAPLKSVLDRINQGLSHIVIRGMVVQGSLSEMKILSIGHDSRNLIVEAELSGDLTVSVDKL